MLEINYKKKNQKTQLLLDKYRNLLKAKIKEMKIEQGSILMVRSRSVLSDDEIDTMKKELEKVVGHNEFKIIFSPAYDTLDVILKDKLDIITGKDILDKWKETKNLKSDERISVFQKWIEDSGLCEGC